MIGERPWLLIVDGDLELSSTLAEVFRIQGYWARVCNRGEEALSLLLDGLTPNLMLLDMHVAGLDGWELAHELRRAGIVVRTLVMTADDNPAVCAEQVGAAGYLAKPFGPTELFRQVESLLASPPHAA